MKKIHESTYLDWKGEEYYRFGPDNWMQLYGSSLELYCYELDHAYDDE